MQEQQPQTDFTNQPAPPSVTARLYDADAPQRVGLTLKNTDASGKRRKYSVAHLFRAFSDEEFFQYEDRKNLVQTVSGTDVLSVRTSDQNLQAAEWLWNLLATGREGYVERADWRAKTNLLDKQTAIERGLLVVFGVNDEDESKDLFAEELAADEVFDDEMSDESPTVVRLDCLFDQAALTTAHHFRQPSAQDVADYEKLMRRVKSLLDGRKGFRQRKKDAQTAQIAIPSKARELCALYDRLIVRTEGYAGRVPAHHKREAVLEIFAREADVTEKNS